jgi:hypothetical protein
MVCLSFEQVAHSHTATTNHHVVATSYSTRRRGGETIVSHY